MQIYLQKKYTTRIKLREKNEEYYRKKHANNKSFIL